MERLREYLWPVLLCAAGLVLAHHETVLAGFAFTQSDLGDTRFVNYLLEHSWRWLTRWPGHRDFWDAPFFYPAKNVLAYSEVMLGAAPFYWPFRLLGIAPDTAFQLWVLTLGVLNFASLHYLLRRCFGLPVAGSSAGAALFAFAAIRINQTMHYQLFPHFWSVLCLIALLKLFSGEAPADPERTERRRMLWIWVFGISAALQLWASFYLGWFLGFALTVALAWAVASRALRAALWALVKAHPFTLLLAGAASALIVVPLATHYLASAQEVGLRTFDEALSMIPAPRAWVHQGQFSWFYGWMAKLAVFRRIPMEHEQRVGFGLLTSAIGIAGLWHGRKSPAVRLVALTGLTVLVVSTLYGAFTPWKLVFELFPGAKAIRAVARIGLLLLVPFGLGIALFTRKLAEKGRVYGAGGVLLALLAVLEQGQTNPAFDKHRNRRDIAEIVKHIPEGCGAFVFSPVQGYGPYWKYQLDAMWAHLESGVPTLNGYSGSNPPGWGLGDTNLHSEMDELRVAGAIRQWVQQRELEPSSVCWVKVGLQEGPYGSEYVSQELPRSMVAGDRYPVAVTFRNLGPEPWRVGQHIRLGSQAPRDNLRWGTQRVELPQDAKPGETVTFRFEIVAPSQPGPHPFQWRMLREGMMWFGAASELVTVQVEEPQASRPP